MKTLGRISTYLIIAFFLLTACNDDDPSTGSGNIQKTFLKAGTESIMLEVKSSVDGKIVPTFLALPKDRSTPLKGAVVLHGSGGVWSDMPGNCNVGQLSSQFKEWKDLLNKDNMFAVFPDSYSNRGTCENEGAYKEPPLKFAISATFIRNADAYAVLSMLQNLYWEDTDKPVIDVDNIALLGFSDGGSAVISTLYDLKSTPKDWQWSQQFSGITYTKEVSAPAQPTAKGFKVGVVYYAGAFHNSYYGSLCNQGKGIYKSTVDMLIHLPEDDPLTPNAECLINTMKQNGGGVPTVYEYPSTDHGFDSEEEPQSTTARERTLNYIRLYLAK